tara:strand:- start:6551 stop:6952 length:402 start_codon:yes stop_codon:yes gene_type:complete
MNVDVKSGFSYLFNFKNIGGHVMSGVGTEKVFENDKVIVWNFELAPGEETAIHKHELSYIWYAISGSTLQVYDEHGKDLGAFEVPTGAVFHLKVEDDEIEVMSEIGKGARIPAKHKAVNAGSTPYREVLVEWK